MNERLKELAEQAGWSGLYSVWLNPNEVILLPVPVTELELERFAELVRQDEREACAKLIDGLAYDSSYPYALRYAAQSLRNQSKG